MKKIALIFLVTILLISGCASPQTATPTAQAGPTEPENNTVVEQQPAETEPVEVSPVGGTVTRALTSEPTSLDPHGPVGSGQNVIFPYLFDTLVYRQSDNTYHPYLAESWTISDDGLEIQFKLKEGVLFHDGTPLDAEAVKYTYQRLIDQGARSPIAGGLSSIESIEVVDDLTITFWFTQPSSIFFSTISTPYAGIISPTAAEASGEAFGQNPVGSGAFMLESWVPGEAVTLVRNPDYAWGPSVLENQKAAYLEKLVFTVIPDAAMQVTAFQAGEVDILFVNSPGQIARLKEDPNAVMMEATLNSLIYLGFNCQAAPFDDPLVRQAVAHAIDKQELVDVVLGGTGETAFSPLTSSLPGFDPALKSEEHATDPAKTADLLQQAGYTAQADGSWAGPDGAPLEFELMISTRAPNEALATVLQEQLKRAGIGVSIRSLESAAIMETAVKGEYQALLWRYDWNDADVLNVYLSTSRIGRTNRSFYSNLELDALLEQAATELDTTKRNELYSKAQSILMDEVPWIPLYTPKDIIVVRSSVEGVQMGAMGRLLLNDAVVRPPQ